MIRYEIKNDKKIRKAFSLLPGEIQDQGRNAYRQFKINTWHSSLRLKCVHSFLPIYSLVDFIFIVGDDISISCVFIRNDMRV